MPHQKLDSPVEPSGLSNEQTTDATDDWSRAKATADGVLFRAMGKYLSDIETQLLAGAWRGKTYEQMGIEYGYSAEYLNKDVGNKLWRKLSQSLGERVTKRNFKEALHRAHRKRSLEMPEGAAATDFHQASIQAVPDEIMLPFPEGAVALNSPFYIERGGIDSQCYRAIEQPGALLRIKAPMLMGKTSLVHRILAQTNEQVGQTVYLDLSNCDRTILGDLDKFLRRFCAIASQQLGLDNQLGDRWDTDILGSNDNCTAYFEEYLLPAAAGPIVIGMDECDRLFAYPHVAEDVLGMLRSWHERGKVSSLWQRLRLVIAHATDVYIPLDINQSPFNAGIPVELKELGAEQVMDLVHLHDLALGANERMDLMTLVGGHPYLIRLALYHLRTSPLTLAELIANAASEASIYSAHLRRHLYMLQQDADLLHALYQVVTAADATILSTVHMYKLCSTGLVKRYNNCVVPSCQLYADYFSRVLSQDINPAPSAK